jgi:AcrR family transcriptional regulator
VATRAAPRRLPSSRPPAPNRQALLDAAVHLFADVGPAEVSIRDVAAAAGCSHTLVGRHFGSKAGLETAVVTSLADGLATLTDRQCASDDWPPGELVAALRRHPELGRLLVRCGLGELDATPLRRPHNLATCLAGRIEQRRGGDQATPSEPAKVAAYLTLCLVLGLVGYEPLLVAGSRVGNVAPSLRDAAVAAAAEAIAGLGVSGDVELSVGKRKSAPPPAATDFVALDARTALVQAAIELYARRGPSSPTTREMADLAQVNQGLIYHYFESREALLAKAIEMSNSPLQSLAAANLPIDLLEGVRAQQRSRSLVILPRLFASGVDISAVRSDFVVFDRLLAMFDRVPTTARPDGLADPRLAVFVAAATSLGAHLFDDLLRALLGIRASVDLDPAMANVFGHLLAQAGGTATSDPKSG